MKRSKETANEEVRQIERVPISSLTLDPHNVRRHSERNLQAIGNSLQRFGQQRQPVVSADNVVLAGNGLVTAATALGWTHIDIVRTSLTGDEAKAFAIADNRSSELAEWDEDALAEMLSGLDPHLQAAAGWSPDEMMALAFTEQQIEGQPDQHGTDASIYAANVLKQIVLYYSGAQYDAVWNAMSAYAEQHGLSDNSEVVAHLLEAHGHAVAQRDTA